MDNRNSKIYTKISDIEVSRVIVVLFFSTEISIGVKVDNRNTEF